jgi:ATP/maltotriose-dependent transcriptional regulator MalT
MIQPLARSPERGITPGVEGGRDVLVMGERPATKGRVRAGKHPQTLATKVLPPRCVGLIERPRLLEFISQVQMKRLSVIKAPAGFGKTSLAVAWAARLLQSGSSFAWFSIDVNDNQPTQFLFYVAHALQRAWDGTGSPAIDLILETSLIDPHAIISTLINGLAEIDEEICLFLEDYHWVSDPAIHDAVAFLLRHAPSQFHLVLVTRTEPPLPLAGLRAQNQLLETNPWTCALTWTKRSGFSTMRASGRWSRPS